VHLSCFPRFDSGACFVVLLGDRDNGRWLLAPAQGVRGHTRRYRTDTVGKRGESVSVADENVSSLDVVRAAPPRQRPHILEPEVAGELVDPPGRGATHCAAFVLMPRARWRR
jgi:hypothetical protein